MRLLNFFINRILSKIEKICFEIYRTGKRYDLESQKAYRDNYLSENAQFHESVKFHESARVLNFRGSRESIQVGAKTSIKGELLTFAHGGYIEIGQFCHLGENSRIWSASKIIIGKPY